MVVMNHYTKTFFIVRLVYIYVWNSTLLSLRNLIVVLYDSDSVVWIFKLLAVNLTIILLAPTSFIKCGQSTEKSNRSTNKNREESGFGFHLFRIHVKVGSDMIYTCIFIIQCCESIWRCKNGFVFYFYWLMNTLTMCNGCVMIYIWSINNLTVLKAKLWRCYLVLSVYDFFRYWFYLCKLRLK